MVLSQGVGKSALRACSALNVSKERLKSNSLIEDILAARGGWDHG